LATDCQNQFYITFPLSLPTDRVVKISLNIQKIEKKKISQNSKNKSKFKTYFFVFENLKIEEKIEIFISFFLLLKNSRY